MQRTLFATMALLLTLLFAFPLSAQDAQHAEAQALVEAGLKDARAKRFDDAVVNFDKAFKLFPHADISHNLGRAQEELGRHIEAIDAFKRALDMDPGYKYASDARARISKLDETLRKTHGVVTFRSTPEAVSLTVEVAGEVFASLLTTPVTRYVPAGPFSVRAKKAGFVDIEQKAEVALGADAVIDLLLRPVPKKGFLTVTADAEGAQVFVDGELIGAAPVEGYALSAGRHALKIKAPGRETFEASIEVSPNAEERVGATLALASVAEEGSSYGLVGGVLLGSGGGVAAIATTLWIFAAKKAEEARTAPNDTRWEEAKSSAKALEAGAWVSASAALGLLGTGAALLILSGQDDEQESAQQWTPLLTPTEGGLGVGALVRF